MRLRHAAGLSAAVVSAVVGLPFPAAAEPAPILYVNNLPSAGCSDSGTGTAAKPYCTIQAAADDVLPGQTVDVIANEFEEDLVIRRSGEPGKPITFRGEGRLGQPGKYSMPGLNGPSQLPVSIAGGHDIVFSGFSGPGFDVSDSTRIELSGNMVWMSGYAPGRPGIRVTGQSEDVTIARSVFLETPGAVQVFGPAAKRVKVVGNDFTSTNGVAVFMNDAPGAVITNNSVRRVATTHIAFDLGGASNGAVIANNAIGSGTVRVSPQSAEQTRLDHNNIRPAADHSAYQWAGSVYSTAAQLYAATGQGEHDLNDSIAYDETYLPLSVPQAGVGQTSGLRQIDSADPDAPGVPATDLLGQGPVDHPTAANNGPGGTFRDRGAYEATGLRDVRLEATGTASPSPAGPAPLTVDFKATATNTWGTTLSYTFDFGDGSAPVTTAEPTVRHTYTAVGEFHPQVTVTDGTGARVTERLADPVRAGADTPLAAGLTVVPKTDDNPLGVSAQPTATGPWQITGYTLDFGDGSWVRTGSSSPSSAERHAYGKPGTYTVTLTVTDEKGAKATATQQVTVGYTPAGFTAIAPTRVLDTRVANSGYTWLGTGDSLELYVRGKEWGNDDVVPAGATAVVLNLTATQGTATSHLDAYPAGGERPTTSNVNFTAGQDVANLVTVPIGPDGRVVIRNNNGRVHVIADVLGYYKPDAPAKFTALAPARLLDTRSAAAPITQGGTQRLKVAGQGGVPASATSVVLNVTATGSTAPSFFTVYPAGTPRPATGSNLNTVPGRNIPNQVIVPLGADGSIDIYNNAGSSHAVVDVSGYFSPEGKGLFTPVTPNRLFDSRATAPFGPGATRTVTGVPAGAVAAAINLTATETGEPTHLTAWATGSAKPGTSNLNATPGLDVPNHTTVPVDADGRFDIANNSGSTHVIADLFGYYRNQ